MRNELKKYKRILSSEDSDMKKNEEVEDVMDEEEEKLKRIREEHFLMITLDFLRTMKQREFAESLKISMKILLYLNCPIFIY